MKVNYLSQKENTMGITVIGAGHLGWIIAELLSDEGYDVIVADTDEEKLSAIRDSLDVLTFCADGTNPSFMRRKEVRECDIVVAVTAQDEVNIIACMLAKKNGIPHTIARIRDPKYLSEPEGYLRENFDLDLVLSPEQITAHEISRILMTPSALNVEDFAEGKVRLVGMKIGHRSPLPGKPLKELRLPENVLAALIIRDHRRIIPHGEDILRPLDTVYFLGTPQSLEQLSGFASGASHYRKSTRRALIIGAGRTGNALAPLLEKDGISVKVIDKDRLRCEAMAERLKKGVVLCGDGTDPELLSLEGAADADTVICTTKDDKLNLMIALLTKHLGAGQAIAQVQRPEYVELFQQVGVDIVLSTRMLAAGEVMAFVRSSAVLSVSLLEGSRVQALEILVGPSSPAAGLSLMQARLPKECLVGAIVHDGAFTVPSGRSVLSAGDRIIIITETDAARKVISYFKGKE